MADNETIADIIVEMRKLAHEFEDYGGVSIPAMLLDFSDRLEAAIKREKAAIEADALTVGGIVEAERKRERGDAAKLREALVKCREIALQWLADEAAGVAGTTDKPHARSAAEAVVDMEFEINAGLSASPRNCDKYANHNDAMRAFDAFVREQGKLGFINPYTEAFKWLFATATEGGVK